MMKFNREEGLTLIELLITIAVIAIVAAISVPVITNVVASSNANAATQTAADINSFVSDGAKSGVVQYTPATTSTPALFELFVDLNGDNTIDSAEKVSELTIDPKFTINGLTDATADPTTYTTSGVANAGVTGVATVTVAGQ